MKGSLLRFGFVSFLWLVVVTSLSHAAKPNVILCMADDLGWGDTGYNGHPVLKTPHLDAMAANGLVFDRFYAAAPVCSPTRGSCLTGRHPSRYGIPTANAGHLRAGEITLAEVLHNQGYATGHFGKWHLGTLTPDFSGKGRRRKPRDNFMTPAMAGFDTWFSTEYAVATWDPYLPEHAHGRFDVRSLYWQDGRNLTDAKTERLTGGDSRIIMDRALPFIESAVLQEKPFFTVIWFHAPHAPVIGGPNDRARYPDQPIEKQHYYATVSELDAQVGRLRNKLRELGVARDTMLWFCSDNGPEGNPGPRGRSQGSTGPLRGRKRSLYEGGVRVPGILEWPARIVKSRRTKVPAVTSDFFPTVLAALGLTPADTRPMDGISLLPLIEGKVDRRRHPIAFAFQGRAALTEDYFKLVHHPKGRRHRSDTRQSPVAEWELYDLSEDPGETHNLAAEHPAIVTRMRRTLQAWQASCQVSAAGKDYPETTKE